MNMKKLVGAAVCTAALVGTVGTSYAGEVTGKGKPTPVNSYVARSICAFSGQNDDPDSTELFDGGRVQSFGDIVQEAIKINFDEVAVGVDRGGASALVPIIVGEGPGKECPGTHR